MKVNLLLLSSPFLKIAKYSGQNYFLSLSKTFA